jgi:hypothetical protein
MSKDPKPTEKSDDELLTRLGAQFSGRICRQRFGLGKRKVCILPKGHKGGHKA